MLKLFWSKANICSDSLNIHIKLSNGKTFPVQLEPEWKIKNVRELVASQLDIQPNEIKIIFAGKELCDDTSLTQYDIGQHSILHAVHIKNRSLPQESSHKGIKEEDLQNSAVVEKDEFDSFNSVGNQAHFFVYCSTCKILRSGKLRVRCNICKGGAFTVHSDPQNWNDVLEPKQISGLCENGSDTCIKQHSEENQLNFAEFYFKCGSHTSLGENDSVVPLYLIRPNLKDIPCLACTDVCDRVLAFPCQEDHVTCLDCFRQYCLTRLRERQFQQHPEYGYTLICPIGCPDSYIKEVHHFRLLTNSQYLQYHKFAAEEFVLQAGGVFCPQPGCGMGILCDQEFTKIVCINGCGHTFCRHCLQPYHTGECESNSQKTEISNTSAEVNKSFNARSDEASKFIIKIISKSCPKCKTRTERDGGCMHMVCTRPGCGFDWCWVCHKEWTRNCMSSHWFG